MRPAVATGAAKRVLPRLVVVVVMLSLLVGRVLWSSREELDLGRRAYDRGDREAAVLHLGRAAHWYVPGSPWVSEALEELRQIGRQAELEGQLDLALAAYRTIRRSCLGTRSLYIPHSDQLHRANERIAAILARQPPPPVDRNKTVAQRQREHLALLENFDQPDPLWSLLAGLAFLAWVGAAFGFSIRALGEGLSIKRPQAIRWGVAFLVGFVLWVVALSLA